MITVMRVLMFCLVFQAFGTLKVMAAAQLSQHPSPYLRLHADDPVNWKTWSTEVLKQAQDENRLLIHLVDRFECT